MLSYRIFTPVLYIDKAAARDLAAAWWGVEELNPYRRKMPNWYVDTVTLSGARSSVGHPTYAFSHQYQYLFHPVSPLEKNSLSLEQYRTIVREGLTMRIENHQLLPTTHQL